MSDHYSEFRGIVQACPWSIGQERKMDGLGLEYSDNLGPGFCFPAQANGSNCTDENFFFISGHSEHFLFLFNCTDGLFTILKFILEPLWSHVNHKW